MSTVTQTPPSELRMSSEPFGGCNTNPPVTCARVRAINHQRVQSITGEKDKRERETKRQLTGYATERFHIDRCTGQERVRFGVFLCFSGDFFCASPLSTTAYMDIFLGGAFSSLPSVIVNNKVYNGGLNRETPHFFLHRSTFDQFP